MGFLVEQPGLLTTIQDSGRTGFQQYGMPQSGAVDQLALHMANLLLDNDPNEAVLEITIMGPRLVLESSACIALTGADLSPTLNGKPLPRNCAVSAAKGSVLAFGACRSGCRAYLAVSGGFDLPPVMGSRSTYLKGAVGGLEGRALRAGDHISFRAPRSVLPAMQLRGVPAAEYPSEVVLRAVPGPHGDYFTQRGRDTFWGSAFTLGKQFDRMGCRLEGAQIELCGSGNIISDGVTFGTVQVPEAGQPIIMLADRQTTGGYPQIACVITADLPRIAQCKGGDRVRFQPVTVEEGQEAYRIQQEELYRMPERWNKSESGGKLFHVLINGRSYDVTVSPL